MVRLWDPYSSSLPVLKAILAVLCTGLFQRNASEALSATLLSAGLVDRVQAVLRTCDGADKDLLLHGVPVLLRLGFHDGDEPHVINDEVRAGQAEGREEGGQAG